MKQLFTKRGDEDLNPAPQATSNNVLAFEQQSGPVPSSLSNKGQSRQTQEKTSWIDDDAGNSNQDSKSGSESAELEVLKASKYS